MYDVLCTRTSYKVHSSRYLDIPDVLFIYVLRGCTSYLVLVPCTRTHTCTGAHLYSTTTYDVHASLVTPIHKWYSSTKVGLPYLSNRAIDSSTIPGPVRTPCVVRVVYLCTWTASSNLVVVVLWYELIQLHVAPCACCSQRHTNPSKKYSLSLA